MAALRTTARRSGNGWVLNGSKILLITNGVHADLYFVAARTDLKAKGPVARQCLSSRKVRLASTSHDRLTNLAGVLRHRRTRLYGLSDPGGCSARPREPGILLVMRNFQNERLVLGVMAVGEFTRALEITRRHVKERKAFGGVLGTSR